MARIQNSEIGIDEHYHVFNRGNEKRVVFLDDRDYSRFLFLILHFQSHVNFFNLTRPVNSFVRRRTFNIDSNKIDEIIENRIVKLEAFCLMPNHFHLLVQEIEGGGIAKYMHRVLTAYAKYFNTKYKHSGHVFQGKYKTNHVEDSNQYLYLSAYIHKNPEDYANHFWSSYPSFTKTNPWPRLLNTNDLLDQFEGGKEYADWVRETTAKENSDIITPHDVDMLEV